MMKIPVKPPQNIEDIWTWRKKEGEKRFGGNRRLYAYLKRAKNRCSDVTACQDELDYWLEHLKKSIELVPWKRYPTHVTVAQFFKESKDAEKKKALLDMINNLNSLSFFRVWFQLQIFGKLIGCDQWAKCVDFSRCWSSL